MFDYSKSKIIFLMRFFVFLMSVGFFSDGLIRVIGISNGIIYMGKRKKEKLEESREGDLVGFYYRE